MINDLKLGAELQYGDVTIKACFPSPKERCKDCYFEYSPECRNSKIKNVVGECSRFSREDKQDIIFKRWL